MAGARVSSLRRLYFDRIFQRSYWTWRRHPAIIVPSMLTTAVSVIEQSIVTLALIVLLTSLAARGLLPSFLTELNQSGLSLSLLQDPRFSSDLLILIAAIAVPLFLVVVLGSGFVLSAEFGTYLQAWKEDKASLGSVLDNGSRRWKPMAWTFFVSNLITWGPAIIAYAILLLSIALGAGTPGGLAAVLVSSQLAELGILTSLIISIFTVYSYPAVVVDQASGLGAVRHSFRVASHNLGITLTYGLVRSIFQLVITLVVLTAGFAGLPLSSVSAAILSLLLSPILHSTKTMIYTYAGAAEREMPFHLGNPIWNDIGRRLPRAAWRKIRVGLSEIFGFMANLRNVPFHFASTVAFVTGILLGDYVSRNGIASYLLSQGYTPGQGNPLINQVVPPVLGVDIFLNNWLVSIATALAGIGFGIPSFQTILFNGFVVGIIFPLSPNLTMLLAALLPHGIIEIPSFVLSGSIGIKLGWAAWKLKFQPGQESHDYLSLTLRQTVYIVVGLAPLFLIAGLIEGDITPIIMRLAGWKF